jgi:hypothetical protein
MVTRYERSWQFDFDRAPSDNSTNTLLSKSALWYWKAFLKGEEGGTGLGLWTVEGSSDGATGSLDATDRWGGTFTPANIVRAAPGNQHSWITLKSPNAMGPVYLTLDYSGAADNQITIVFGESAPAGGTVNDRPTHSDEWVYTDEQFNDGTTGAHLFHGLLTVTGDFIFLQSKTNSGRFNLGFLSQRLADTRTTDSYITPSFFEFNALGVMSRFSLNGTTNKWKGRNHDGTALVEPEPMHGATDSTTALTIDTNRIPFEDMQADAIDGKYDDLPMYLYVQDTSQKSLRGRLSDLRWCPSVLADASAEPATGTVRSMIAGNIWIPADVVPTL